MKALKLFLIFTFSVITLKAQNSFVIKDVRVFDGDTIIDQTSVRVANGRIVEISEAIILQKKDEIIDGKGKTLIPALSNAHVHAWSPQSLKDAAKAGVLNVMDMHGVEPYQTAMRQLKDSTDYARYYVAGYAATAPNGHGTQFGFPVPTLTKPENAVSFVENRIKANVDYIKIIVEPWKETLSLETVSEIIEETHKAKMIAVVHISRLEDAINVLNKNADGLVHIWWDKPIETSELETLTKNKSFFVIPTLLTTLKAFESMGEGSNKFLKKEDLLNEVKKMHDANIPILAGTDPPNLGINYGTDLYKEMQLLREAGLSNIEVLKTVTSNVANAFSLKETGFVKEGYLADLILIEGDVIEDINAIMNQKKVWKKGQLLKE
ncbi:amidohydrolase [Winogradskyella sp. J14-2]|uniref:amidohydrolase family protein n=1 Tax=Winogradskyella sp. J14-2 TaxID=1936080 RepID=UPI000972D148|nr:amidohydrolase family protein [Winogradskyella sp. J14-2]APY09223.1 amidohydrolase [Winogradskyella sp. J14-2]